jgi:peptide/nickel transport system permease protein
MMEQQVHTAVFAPKRTEQRSTRSWLQLLSYGVRRQPLGAAGAVIVFFLILAAVFAAQLAPYHPRDAILPPYHAPTRDFVLGTDHLGRDIFSRILWGPVCPSMSGWCQ